MSLAKIPCLDLPTNSDFFIKDPSLFKRFSCFIGQGFKQTGKHSNVNIINNHSTRRVIVDDIDVGMFSSLFETLADETTKSLKEAGVLDEEIRISRQIEARYFGQTHEIEVFFPEEE